MFHACVCACVSVVPTVLVANKADLEIGREVTTEEGQKLAKDLRCVWVFVFLSLYFLVNQSGVTLKALTADVKNTVRHSAGKPWTT